MLITQPVDQIQLMLKDYYVLIEYVGYSDEWLDSLCNKYSFDVKELRL
jgi:hypothetical protein